MVGSDGFFVREPQQMKNLESVTVVAARASMSHSLLLTNMGKNLFSCKELCKRLPFSMRTLRLRWINSRGVMERGFSSASSEFPIAFGATYVMST